MSTPLSDLVDNLPEINKKECETYMERKNTKSESTFIEYKNDRLNYKCKECSKKCSKTINKLIKKFPIVNQFCKTDLNKFVLSLRKGVYPYEYMYSWEKFNETSIPDKKAFYSELNKECITDENYEHAQKVWKAFEIKNIGEYYDLYVQCNALLLADVFEHFRDKCIEIYKLDPAHFLSAPGLAWQACLKKASVKLELLADINMLLMVEEGIRVGMCQSVYRYAKANNKYMKNYYEKFYLHI